MAVKCMGFGRKENKDKFFIYTVVSGVKGYRRHKVLPRPLRPATTLNSLGAPTMSHFFKFVQARLVKKQPNHHSQRLLRKLQHLVCDVQPEDSPYSGLLISPTLQNNSEETFDVKLKIFSEQLHKPVCFSCPAATRVGYLVESIQPFLGSPGKYVFKVTGLDEYLSNDTLLSDYAYICACRRVGKVAWLTIVNLDNVQKPWTLVTSESCDLDIEVSEKITFVAVRDALETFESQVEQLIGVTLSTGGDLLKAAGDIRASVTELCQMLNHTETNIQIRSLPRETRMYLTVVGHRDGVDHVLGWTGLNIFADREHFNGGEFLLGLWSPEMLSTRGPVSASEQNKGCLLVTLPHVKNQAVLAKSITRNVREVVRKPFHELSADVQQTFLDLTVTDVSTPLPTYVRDLIWEHRHHLCDFSSLLPHLLKLPVCWNSANIEETYTLVRSWCPLSPEESLTLLSPAFPDSLVKKYAVQSLQSVGSDELSLYLAQLVESLRFQNWDDSFLATFLLRRARQSVRLAHQLFWWLTGMINEPLMRDRALIMRKALFFVAGEKVTASLLTQIVADEMLAETARSVKQAADSQKEEVMRKELAKLNSSLQVLKLRLPLDPAMSVESVDVDTCCVFPSKTLPIKLVFQSSEEAAEKIETIYKAGDDLRQDVLMLTVIRLMDKLWLESGMDLKMLTFKCTTTGESRGFLEAVRDVSTLRTIQTNHSGVTGAFSNRTIADWLWKHNSCRPQYQVAVDNFIKSCAGCCVATYVLGVGDRHNDNILLATSGHMLHIDFSKVLGHAETFGGIKRDRAPFALTPDMVYVIRRNGGEAQFVRLCCEAYNVLRRNSSLFLALFSIMKHSGLPDVDQDALAYLRRSMSLEATDEQAARHFEKRIRESVMTLATSFNFFIHNLASLGANTRECALRLSFNPRDFSVAAEGKIVQLTVEDIRLRYHPERYHVYVVNVEREFPPTQSVVRTYKNFLELYTKMSRKFPACDFHPLSRGSVFSTEGDESLALKRKRDIQQFLDTVMAQPEDVSHYRLVYSFFHPLPRDLELLNGVPITIAT
ncbi:hypothetical protein HPB47_025066 [Ixodes persulcatus]|uniref:Uncharacterized protein n=1 Tax=Ixodes persulcatus TaxID=34615 RepID=A0AC60Q2I7_IXOPE|nr:hypothetical protein HPB47_025066 [Ixodes persulcatus]